MNIFELLLLAAIWGASFLFMRIAVPELGPLPLITLRVGIAALVLAPVLRLAAARSQLRAKLWPLFVVGLTNSALPFCLLAYSTLYVNAGLDSVLNATTPLWAAAIGAAAFRIPIQHHQTVGLLIGLLGVVVLVSETLGGGAVGGLRAVVAALLATFSYGFAVNYSKRRLAGVQPFVVAFGSQFFAAVALLPLALLSWPTHSITPSTWGYVGALGIFCTGFAYVLFFRLVENVGSAYAASVTFLIPIFGVIWGAAFLGEHITPMTLIGGAIILFGTAVASGKIASGLMKKSAIPR